MNRKEYRQYKKAVADFFHKEGIDCLSSDDGEPCFDHSPCECCGRSLSGNRETCSGYNPKTQEIYTYKVCSDCVYFATYGELDDLTMLAIADSPEESSAELLIDLDGVLYEGDKAVNGGAEAVAWLQQEGIPFRFVTNTSSRPRQNIVEKLAAMGVSVTVEQLFTPPVAARQWLVDQQVASVALFVPVATATEFVGLPVVDSSLATGVDAVVLGDLGQGWSFERLNQAFVK